MNLSELLQMQKELDAKIIKKKDIKLSKEELLLNTFVALDVELSEMANEAQWFKIWKKNNEPRSRLNLIEEYVDALHFFLSIANQMDLQESMYLHIDSIDNLRAEGVDGGMNGLYCELKYYLSKLCIEIDEDVSLGSIRQTTHEFHFTTAWFLFIAIGLIGFGFTEEDIEVEYYRKNKINHCRQSEGY